MYIYSQKVNLENIIYIRTYVNPYTWTDNGEKYYDMI